MGAVDGGGSKFGRVLNWKRICSVLDASLMPLLIWANRLPKLPALPQEANMPEKKISSSNVKKENTTKDDQDQQAKLAVRLALIEHGSRPLAILLIGVGILLWLTWVRDPLFEVLKRTQDLKFGSL